MDQLEDLLRQCTVKISVSGQSGWGTGFFVAPGLILTCAHVVKEVGGQTIEIQWQKQENWAQAVVVSMMPEPHDLALLQVSLPLGWAPPCVYLDDEVRSRHPLYLFGYPDDGEPYGEPRTFNCDGTTGSEIASILFNFGQVRPGMSGAPLLNQKTGKVCGIVKFTRDRSTDLGGGAIPSRVILEQFPQLRKLQRQFHQSDRRWSKLLPTATKWTRQEFLLALGSAALVGAFLIKVNKFRIFDFVTVDAEGKHKKNCGIAQFFTEDLGNGVSLEMVVIPGGTFQMGSLDEKEHEENEKPQHIVRIESFCMSRYEVTQSQWKAIAALQEVNRKLELNPSHFQEADHPVEQITWEDAVEFCHRLSNKTGRQYRLPSEAEWEYACRAGTTTPFHFGETITTDLANYCGTDCEKEGNDDSGSYGFGPKGINREKTTAVGSFSPNAFGLNDMHGNVWEWCSDHWHENYKDAPTNGSPWINNGVPNKRVLRGGSWNYKPGLSRSANREGIELNSIHARARYIGFRVVCPRLL